MRLRTRVLLGAVATSLVLALACSGPEPSTDPDYGRCTEDMPCWDCHTMGNLVCGPDQP